MNLIEFLRARLDEDKEVAQSAHYEGQRWISEEEDVSRWPEDELVHFADRKRDAAHIARHDPARVLREVAAKRRIIAVHEGHHECPSEDDNCGWIVDSRCVTLRLLALPYADRLDYDEEWRP